MGCGRWAFWYRKVNVYYDIVICYLFICVVLIIHLYLIFGGGIVIVFFVFFFVENDDPGGWLSFPLVIVST